MRSGTSVAHTFSYTSNNDVSSNIDVIASHVRDRSGGGEAGDDVAGRVGKVKELHGERVRLIGIRDSALNEKKKASSLVGSFMKSGDKEGGEREKERSLTEGKRAEECKAKLKEVDDEIDEIMSSVPNLLDDRVPSGESEEFNVVVDSWGDESKTRDMMGWSKSFVPQWHDDVAVKLGGWESERAAKISGSRFVALKGDVALLERAIGQFLVDTAIGNGYTLVSSPLVVGRSALTGTGQLPKFEEDLFRVSRSSHLCNGEDAFLIPTAEVTLTNLHSGEIIPESDLPIKYVSMTSCFRAEAGSYGRDTRGLIRNHQFDKVEIVKVTTEASSDDEHMSLISDAEDCLRLLELPYRKVLLCSSDVGFGAQLCYDLEVWMAGQGEYREISSCSNTGDFQSRRMGLRYRPETKPCDDSRSSAAGSGGKEGKAKKQKPRPCHTMNGSALAVGRTLVAVLENYQIEGGGVRVPNVLRKYMGGRDVIGG